MEKPALRGQVDLDGVSFSYQGDAAALRGVNLHIAAGSTVALVGPTGAGKTSIANLIARFYEATEGTVSIDGMDIRRVTQRSLRRQMALVPQDPFLFSGTVADNIRFGRPEADLAQVRQAAQAANAHEFIERLPLGYETRIVEGGVNLSFGQRQLICITRAILSDPRLLILDEATSAVDTLTEALIQRALEGLLAGRTAVIIAHRLSTVRRADRIYVIEGGAVVDQGTHEELIGREGTYRTLYRAQFTTPGRV
jgi:ABC-type multidrug transport system fused ATPase/permease subunit